MTLYQNKEEFRLCADRQSLLPVWDPNEAYKTHAPKAEEAAKKGLPITFEIRGIIDRETNQVFIAEIHEVIIGVNNQCETEH